jgi:hypothetical protein
MEECWPCPVFANYTLAFALQLREKHGKTSVRVAKEIQSIWYWGLHSELQKSSIPYVVYVQDCLMDQGLIRGSVETGSVATQGGKAVGS